MQTREPRKRVNWIFVIILIVVIPITVFTLLMMNTLPPNTTQNEQKIEKETESNQSTPDSLSGNKNNN